MDFHETSFHSLEVVAQIGHGDSTERSLLWFENNVTHLLIAVSDFAHDQALPYIILFVAMLTSISCILTAAPSWPKPLTPRSMLILSPFELCSSTSITVVARMVRPGTKCSSSSPRRCRPLLVPDSLAPGRGDFKRVPIHAYTGFNRELKLGRQAQMMPTYSSRPDQVPTPTKSAMHRKG